MDRDIPAEKCRFAGAKRAENRRPGVRLVREIHHGDEALHRHPDRKTNPRPGRARTIGGEVDDARDFGSRKPRLAVDRSRQRIADDRLTNLTLHAAERRHRIWKGRGRGHQRITRRNVTGQNGHARGTRAALGVFERDAVDIDIIRRDRRRRPEPSLTRESHVLVLIIATDERERILRTKPCELSWDSIAGHADASDKHSIFVERQATGAAIKRSTDDRHDGGAGIGAEGGDAARTFEFIDVGKEKIRKTDADQRPGRRVPHPRRKMILNNKTGSAAGERILITAQERRRPCFRYGRRDFGVGRLASAHRPDPEHKTFAIRYRDDAVRRDLHRARHRLRDHRLDVRRGELGEGIRGAVEDARENNNDTQFHRMTRSKAPIYWR